MMALIRSVRFLVLYAVVSYLAAAQQPPRFVGTVQAVKADQGEIAIQTDQGVPVVEVLEGEPEGQTKGAATPRIV